MTKDLTFWLLTVYNPERDRQIKRERDRRREIERTTVCTNTVDANFSTCVHMHTDLKG